MPSKPSGPLAGGDEEFRLFAREVRKLLDIEDSKELLYIKKLESVPKIYRANYLNFCRYLSQLRIETPGGAVSFSRTATIKTDRQMQGFFLLIKPQPVGSLEFELGVPIVIRNIQGATNYFPQHFYKKVKKDFATFLIDTLVQAVGKSFGNKMSPTKPFIVFSGACLRTMSRESRRRIATRYLTKPEAALLRLQTRDKEPIGELQQRRLVKKVGFHFTQDQIRSDYNYRLKGTMISRMRKRAAA